MGVRVIRQHITQVPQEIYRRLYTLNQRGNGLMQGSLVDCRRNKHGTIHYIMDGETLIGWTLLFHYPADSRRAIPHCYIYVRKNRRRQGYGRRLLLSTVRYVRCRRSKFRVIPGSPSFEFFRKVKKDKVITSRDISPRLYTNEFG